MKSNWLFSTIAFVLVVALTCLLFFGLGPEDKTDIQLVAFGFILGAEAVIYLSVLIAGFMRSKNGDVIAAGVLYAIASFVINYVLDITTIKTLVVFNISLIIVYLLLLSVLLIPKKK